MLDVPAQVDVLHLHEGYAADAAHGEQTASHGRGVGNDAPVGAVDSDVAHADGVERDVGNGDGEGVDDAGQQSCADAHQPYVVNIGVEPVGNIAPHAGLGDDAHAEHDAHDEQHLLQGTVLQRHGYAALRHLVGSHELAVEGFVDHPQHAEHAEGAEEGGQLGDVVERGDEPQSANTHDEYDDALPAVQTGVVTPIRRGTPGDVQTVGQLAVDHDGRHHPRQYGGQGKVCREVAGRDGSIAPEDESRGVANDGKATAAVGCQHDGRTYIHALTRVLEYAMHNDQHGHGRGQVVQIG